MSLVELPLLVTLVEKGVWFPVHFPKTQAISASSAANFVTYPPATLFFEKDVGRVVQSLKFGACHTVPQPGPCAINVDFSKLFAHHVFCAGCIVAGGERVIHVPAAGSVLRSAYSIISPSPGVYVSKIVFFISSLSVSFTHIRFDELGVKFL